MSYTINPNAKNRWARNAENTMDLSLETDASSVYLDNGRTLEQEIGEGSMVSNVATVDSVMSKVIDGTLDGAYESLIFKGKSLVNLATHSKRQNINVQNLLDSNGRLSWNTTGAWGKVGFTVQGKPNSTYCVKYGDKHTTLGIYVRYVDGLSGTTQPITALNSTCRKFTTDTTGIFTLTLEQGEATTDSWVQDFMILEYIEGMENWDIPYFTGLCDSKMPILRNIGKNLFNGELEMGGYTGSSGLPYDSDIRVRSVEKIFLSKGTYTLSSDGATITIFTIYDLNGVFKKEFVSNNSYCTITLNEDCMVHICVENEKLLNSHIQLEQGSNVTSYESYKTNILRTSEEIVLREVGGVQDTYNLLTGEYVRRIGEVVLDGSENWWETSIAGQTTKRFRVNFISKRNNSNQILICDGILSVPNSEWNVDREQIEADGKILSIRKAFDTVEDFKTWLSQNPLTVQYILVEPITTIVESLTTPFTYENGHIILESGYEGQSLLPTLEYSTVVNKTGLIENVAKTIQRQEKQLTMLEKMLIQNIINLDYNNTLLTLKNEMEEML